MASIFDSVQLYASEWNEVNSRAFTEEEAKSVSTCAVVPSKYGKSVMFQFPNGKRFIPLEPTANVTLGEILDIKNLILVALQYGGTDPDRQGKQILRIRIKEVTQSMSFDNPFGI